MEIKPIYKNSLGLIFKNPYIWLIAFIAILGDLRAVVTYTPFTTRLTVSVIFFVIISITAEAAIIFAFLQNQRGQHTNLVDALMTAVTYLPQLLVLKIAPLVLFSTYIMVLAMLGPLAFIVSSLVVKAILIGLLTGLGLLLLFFMQAWSFFSVCELFTRETSIGESFSNAWRAVWQYKWQIFRICLPLIIIDFILITTLVALGAITVESMFQRIISGEEADRSALLLGEGGRGLVRVEFTINRLANSVLVMGFKNRGVEFASLPLFITNKMWAGIVAAGLGMFLMLLRTAVLAQSFLLLTKPESFISESVRSTFKKA